MTMFEPITNRFFTASEEQVETVKQKLVKKFLDDGYLYVNDIYRAIAELAKENGVPFEEHVWSTVTNYGNDLAIVNFKDFKQECLDKIVLRFDLV